MAVRTKHLRAIPESKWEEVYELFSRGIPVPEIQKQLSIELNKQIKERTLYNLIKQLRDEKKQVLIEHMQANIREAYANYRLLQMDLEDLASACRHDPDKFIKIAKELRSMYEFQMTIAAQGQPIFPNTTEDIAKDELVNELEAISPTSLN